MAEVNWDNINLTGRKMETQVVQSEATEGIWYRQNKAYVSLGFQAHYPLFNAVVQMLCFSFFRNIL